MKLAFIVDPLATFKIYKDSTYVMLREAAARGHQLYILEQQDVILTNNRVVGFAKQLKFNDGSEPWYHLGSTEQTPLNQFDAVVMRKDPPFDMEYIYSTQLLELAEEQGARVFNKPRAIRDFNELIVVDGFGHLAVSYQHAIKAGGFDIVHRDPFDRMLAAQSIIEGAALVTDDAAMKLFCVKCHW